MKATQTAGRLRRLLPIMLPTLILLLSGLFSCNGNSTGPAPQPRPEGWVFMGLAGKHIERVRLFGDYLYACANVDGLWRIRTDNENKQWQFLGLADSTLARPFLNGVNDVAVIGDSVLVGYASENISESGMRRAARGDTSWKAIQNSPRRVILIQPSFHSSATIFAASRTGEVFKSSNRGQTWQSIYFSLVATQFKAIRWHPVRKLEIWMMGFFQDFSELVISPDGGLTWVDRQDVIKTIMFYQLGDSLTFPMSPITDIAFDPADEMTMYLASDWIWKSEDKGDTWSWILKVFVWTISVNPTNPKEIVAGGTSLFRSGDGGKTWATIALPESGASTSYLEVDWQERIVYTHLYEYLNRENIFGVYKFYLP